MDCMFRAWEKREIIIENGFIDWWCSDFICEFSRRVYSRIKWLSYSE